MKIVIGLGNYGNKYSYTFHNLGFLTAECLAERLKVSFKKKECDSLVAKAYIGGQEIIIAKPQTYMNLSGVAAKQLIKKYKADIKDLIVVCDDIDTEKGKLRIKERGSGGTHNGLRNIVSLLESGDFCRVKLGIGKPTDGRNLADYVLSDVPSQEREMFFELINKAASEIERLIAMP